MSRKSVDNNPMKTKTYMKNNMGEKKRGQNGEGGYIAFCLVTWSARAGEV